MLRIFKKHLLYFFNFKIEIVNPNASGVRHGEQMVVAGGFEKPEGVHLLQEGGHLSDQANCGHGSVGAGRPRGTRETAVGCPQHSPLRESQNH